MALQYNSCAKPHPRMVVLSSQLVTAPVATTSLAKVTTRAEDTADIEARIAKLHSS